LAVPEDHRAHRTRRHVAAGRDLVMAPVPRGRDAGASSRADHVPLRLRWRAHRFDPERVLGGGSRRPRRSRRHHPRTLRILRHGSRNTGSGKIEEGVMRRLGFTTALLCLFAGTIANAADLPKPYKAGNTNFAYNLLFCDTQGLFIQNKALK